MEIVENEEAKRQNAETAGHEGQVVVFRLSDEEFGMDITNVREIVRLPDITPIPRSPDYVSGICNLRGNVLPVINARIRFSMNTADTTDHTRLLVVESSGVLTGLIVDSVREVMRMSDVHVEPPPPVCRGIDREFLSGVVKVNNGERLILMLNLNEVLSSEDYKIGSETEISAVQEKTPERLKEQVIEEEQLVSFNVAGEEYAFDISKVREILKITEVTSVPNVPAYVKGLFTIRNHLLPIVDLRGLLGLPGLDSEHQKILDKGADEDRQWVENLKHVLESGAYFTGTNISKQTTFGKWIEDYKTTSVEIEKAIKRLKKARVNLFNSGANVLEMRDTDKTAAVSFFEENTRSLLKMVSDNVEKFKTVMGKHLSEDQRALVVEVDSMTIGFLVDWVDEVIRIPRSVIDQTPVLATSERREIKAVAKLDQGERLIMIMDEAALVSGGDQSDSQQDKGKKEVSEMTAAAEEKSLSQQTMDEEQLVTFSINKEEYGIHIMRVQEINRVTEITTVPRSPYFIDGMTNLRGNVIPVIGIRSLFGLEDREIDDRTRIIIVDIKGNKTGLRVDEVKEVLRLSKQDIEKTPGIVICGGANKFMEGVCKLNAGKRMVVLLNVEKILDENELGALSAVSKHSEPDQMFKRQAESKTKEVQKQKTTKRQAEVQK